MNGLNGSLFRVISYVGALMLLISLAAPADAQNRRERRRPQTAQQPPAQPKANESADISITATVTARELKFEVVPNTRVEFSGTFARDTIWEAERENLPRPVEPGVIYQNIGVRLVITSIFPEPDRVVSGALGESSRPAVSPPKRPEPPAPPLPLSPRRQVKSPAGRTQQ
ncbi:MAG TPA: hypothetical protein VF131_24150 [Blastocatellia bacterium]|nr:hypothetical protein [Blastocatellia bacterium]